MSALPAIAPVIMCGGAGTRLWPASTEAWPKPFRAFAPGPTLFQQAVLRVSGDGAEGFLAPVIICGAAHRGLVETQLGEIGVVAGAIVLEPSAQGTAAVAAVASGVTAALHPGALALLSPADHVIIDAAGFRAAVRCGATAAAAGQIVTFGITPDRPETGYGYIQAGERLANGVARVARFVEKPDAATAQAYLDAGDHVWNAGVFLFSPTAMLGELERLRGDIAGPALRALSLAARDGGTIALDAAAFAACPVESIDRAVMEHTPHAAVAACDVGWTDVGSWSELWRAGPTNEAGVLTAGPVTALDVRDSLIWSDGAEVGVIGVEDLIVVVAGGRVLVAPRARAQEVRALVEAMRAAKVGGG
jgi:mannose-1-phosphate guanylyltransferase/mannose-6-phosphate isomerase